MKNIKSNAITFVTNIETKSSGAKTPGDKTNEVSSKYTQKEIEQMEKDRGTKYVSKEAYDGNTNKYDPIKAAAKKSGTNFTSLEQAQHAGGTAFKKFMNAYDPSYKLCQENISRFMSYNQNGSWFGNGSAACKATSLAILASINSGTYIKPNKVGAREKDGYLDTPISSVKGFDGKTYNVNVIWDQNDITPVQQLDKIKSSLHKGNAIAVEVTTKNGSHHWVVVTGTVEGCSINDISSINDLVGIDPWYGNCSSKPDNKLAVDVSKSATINLGDTNKKLGSYNGYGYMTVS